MNSLSLIFGGPNTDYTYYIRENLPLATTPSSGGNATYTFKATVPAAASGSATVWIQGYRNITLNPAPPSGSATVRDVGYNKSLTAAITDSSPVARRQVVATQNCLSCHGVFNVHGGSRLDAQFCPVCHNPKAVTTATATFPGETFHFKIMVHKIHTGEELSNDYSIGSANFNEVQYPGDRRNCQKCHIAGTEQIAFPKGLQASITPNSPINPMQPATAACLSCHDFQEAAAHASLNTSPTLGESCRVCHGPNADISVTKAHAR